MNREIEMLLTGLDEAFDKKSWHGPNLRGSIRGVTAEQAAWRPGPERHNIWELAVHCAYWKYVVRRKLADERRGSFVLKGSNYFRRPEELSDIAWKKDIGILEEEHLRLRNTVVHLKPGPKPTAIFHLVRGAAAHDIYHAGQIRLLRKLQQKEQRL
jgi:hypothetical protein